MTITNGYASVAEFKMTFFPADVSDSVDDAAIERLIEDASRVWDDFCGRTFYAEAATAKYFTAEWSDLLRVDDLVSVTSLVTDEDGDRTYETTWAATDYDLEPYNAALAGKPYTQIRITPDGHYEFPLLRKAVKITGAWGWPSVPMKVKDATLALAFKLYKLKDAPFGVVGSGELGELRRVASILDSEMGLGMRQYARGILGSA